jgi:hypothetical protein
MISCRWSKDITSLSLRQKTSSHYSSGYSLKLVFAIFLSAGSTGIDQQSSQVRADSNQVQASAQKLSGLAEELLRTLVAGFKV